MEFHNESSYCTNPTTKGKLIKVYNSSDSLIEMNCNGYDCRCVLRTYNGCDTSKDDLLSIVSDMCIINKGPVDSEKFECLIMECCNHFWHYK